MFVMILMDIDMPIKNGYQASKEINAYFQKLKINPPNIIACSAYHTKEYQDKAIENGMKHYLVKPVDRIKLDLVLQKFYFS